MTRLPSPVRHNNPAELRAFDTVCDRLGGFEPGIVSEWVDGFLAALAAGPRIPEPVVWLPAMCEDAFDRAFADPEDAAQALHALQVRLKVLCDQLDPQALLDDPEALRLDPLMSDWTDTERERLVREEGVSEADAAAMQTGAVWAEGFLHAVEQLTDLWWTPDDEEQADFYNSLLEQIGLLCVPPGHEVYDAHLARFYPDHTPNRDDLLAEACYAAQDLRVLWVDTAPKPATRRVEPTPGRNEPCPCGSGKKYKKCHGAPA